MSYMCHGPTQRGYEGDFFYTNNKHFRFNSNFGKVKKDHDQNRNKCLEKSLL